MKRKHQIIIAIGVAIWLIETAVFGWNAKPGSVAEARWDGFAIVVILWGIIGDIFSNLEIHKNYYKYKETNIKAKTVEIKGESPTVNNNFGTTEDETRRILTVNAAQEKANKK